MEFSIFKSQVDAYQNTHTLNDNIRYILAKKKIDELFIKWISLPQTQDKVKKLIDEIKKNPQNLLNTNLSPFLTSQNLSTVGPLSLSNTLKPTPHTPPKSPHDFNKMKGIQGHNESGDSSVENSPKHFDSVPEKILAVPTEKPLEPKEELINKKITEFVPKFYFPSAASSSDSNMDTIMKEINEIFLSTKNEDLTVLQFEQITFKVFGLPKFLNPLVFARVDKDKKGKVYKQEFIKTWKNEYANLSAAVRCFNILKKSNSEYITPEDLKPIMNIIMEVHPGLEFLKATPEFQDRYSDTVVQRIFYGVDKNDDSRISLREFKQSNLFDALKHLDSEEDINKVRAYFSYEHFYVLYCKFWELDADHDFLITKEEFSRYSGHALSKKAVDRIFDEVPRKFKSKVPNKMSYDDFIWFALSEEDKTSDRSIEYWFKVIDLDHNDMITGYEMEYFYEEQKQRLEYLNHEPVYFEDIVCQLVDMFHPEKDIIFRMEHFKQHRPIAGTFFNCLTNLNKFVAYEQRDPFMIKNEMTENPDYSEWDRFAHHEYIRLALEEENAENSGMLDSADLWDADDPEPKK